MFKLMFSYMKMIWVDEISDSFKAMCRHPKHVLQCALFGHNALDTEEDGWSCYRCAASFFWTDEHEWIKTDEDVELFMKQIAVTHKRKFS